MKKTDAIAKYYKNPKSRFIESGIICRGLGGGDKGITFFDDNVVAKNDAESKKLIPVWRHLLRIHVFIFINNQFGGR